tara:strand:- start:3403 stop:3795 length:393 start_codon:yes stop_codon:yes gene_type:complete
MTFPAKALSIRQPWCHHILYDGKDIENRNWRTHYRGPVLIHASAKFDGYIHEQRKFIIQHPECHLGGIVGTVEIVDCIDHTHPAAQNTWFQGRYGFVLRNPIALPFTPCKGKLGFFTPDIDLTALKAKAS